jgi:hypothetical protein
MPNAATIHGWIAKLDELIIQRELQLVELEALAERLAQRGARRPSLDEARKRTEDAVERLATRRAALVAQL